MATFINTKEAVPFNTIGIGHLFYAHGCIWVRTTHTAGKHLPATGESACGVCNFMMNENATHENEPEMVYHINTFELSKLLLQSIGE